MFIEARDASGRVIDRREIDQEEWNSVDAGLIEFRLIDDTGRIVDVKDGEGDMGARIGQC